jgi:hypothetical protein
MSYIHPSDKALNSKELAQLMNSADDYFMENFDNIPQDVCLIQVAGRYKVFANKSDITKVKFSEDNSIKILKPYLDTETVEIDGVRYYNASPLITKTKDTDRYVLKDKAFRAENGFYESDKDLVQNAKGDYITKKNAVICQDTKTYESRHSVYNAGPGTYYKYRAMAYEPSDWGHAPYVNETIMPEINERRIGLEYEFGKSYNMFEEFLAGDYKKDWFSTRDGSLDVISEGIEFVSIPFKPSDLDRAMEFLTFSEEHGAKLYDACGFHVHVGAQDFSFLDLTRMITLGTSIEEQMFKLGGADRCNNTYCKKLTERFTGFSDIVLPKDKNKAGKELYNGLNARFEERHSQSKYVDARNHTGIRYYWLNIDRYFYKRNSPKERTIEFRNHVATFDTERFKNYALLCYYAVEFAKNHSKKTCSKADVFDIVKTSHIKHRKQLLRYLTNNL